MDPRELLRVLQKVRDGDFSARLPGDWTGLEGKIADTFNDIATIADRRARETARVSRAVGKEGRLRDGRASYGIGFNFYFGPFELNWVFSKALPYLQVDPFTDETDVVRPSGYGSAFYIGRKF